MDAADPLLFQPQSGNIEKFWNISIKNERVAEIITSAHQY